MSRLEVIDRENWREFLAAPASVLMLGKSNCEACGKWTTELNAFLADDNDWQHVRFGKLELDKGGMAAFKKENAWIAELEDLPYNVIYVNGERKKEFLGSGIDRLVNRMQRVVPAPA
jgi:hypothetical protein